MLPPDTLAALHAAVVASPSDRAVRLVYADALEENGDPADLNRAAFVRGQIELEAMPDDARRAEIEARCAALFSAGWLTWWDTYCVAAGLPRPFVNVKGRGLNAWLARAFGTERRKDGDPYHLAPTGFTVRNPQKEFSVDFTGGFPDVLHLHRYWQGRERLFAALPVATLWVHYELSGAGWRVIDWPSLRRVASLHLDAVAADGAAAVAASPNLTGLTELALRRPTPDAVASLLSGPLGANLRGLTLTQIDHPASLTAVASGGGVGRLTELTIEVVAAIAVAPQLMFGADDLARLGQIFAANPTAGAAPVEIMSSLMHHFAVSLGGRPTDGAAWQSCCEALAAVARSAGRRLTRFRLRLGRDFLSVLPTNVIFPTPPIPMRTLSDDCADAFVGGFGEGLSALELPARLLAPAQRLALERRWGPRLRVV